MQNRLYSYVVERQSDFAKVECSSEGWLSDLDLGKLLPRNLATYRKMNEAS